MLLTLGQVGCPACAGNLDEFHAMGITKVMFCGGGGVLDRDIEVGRILVVDGAIRDEGFSYQYIPPSRVIYTNPEITDNQRVPGQEPHPLSSRFNLDDRRYFSGDSRPNRQEERGRREDCGNGTGRLYCRCAVQRL